GSYTTPVLIPGSYTARTLDAYPYLDQLYLGMPCIDCGNGATGSLIGTAIVVNGGTTTTGIDFALGGGGRVSGRVTDAVTGAGIGNVFVSVYNAMGAFVTSAATSSTGTYTILGLPSGSYYARTSNSLGYTDGLYGGGSCLNCSVTTGTPIAVTAGATTPN